MEEKKEKTCWHCWLRQILRTVLQPRGVEVLSEEMVVEIPRADLILIRRVGDFWTEEQRLFLADGLRDLPTDHILIELKMRESITASALKKISAYDYFYLQRKELDRKRLQSILIGAITPRSDILKQFNFEPTKVAGVYICKDSRWCNNLRVILLNELDNKPHNAFLKCFASRKVERTKAFATIMRSYWLHASSNLPHLIAQLRRLWMEITEETLEYDDITEEEYWAWAKKLMLLAMPIEKMFEDPEFSQYLIQAEKKGEARGEARGEAKGKAEGAKNQAALLSRILEEKFGPLPVEIVEKLHNADLEQLATWSNRAFEMDSLEKIFQ
ncbi:hypothetical protein ACQZV8_03490 [Magnetococcales bacterium HHB-1]